MYGYYTERENEGSIPYTDLALERRRADTTLEGVEYSKEIGIFGTWERIKITSEAGAKSIGRPIGIYDTLDTSKMEMLDEEEIDDSIDEIARELCYLCDTEDIIPERILVAGLGNPSLTPDSLGPRCAQKIKPTMHIREHDERFFYALECSEIAAVVPNVSAVTGIDALTVIKGICDIINPDVVIAIDGLASRSADRLGSTIQLSTTGMLPGSGLGHKRMAINKETVGCPVIGIGIPTVIDSRLFGLSSESDSKSRRFRKRSEAMFVSPKEIDEIVEIGARIIGGGINQAFGMPF